MLPEAQILDSIRTCVYWPLEISLSPKAMRQVEGALRSYLHLGKVEDTELHNLCNLIRSHLQHLAAEADPFQQMRDEIEFLLQGTDRILSMLTPEDLSKLQLYRARISAGEQMPIEEMREAMKLLRSDRLNAAKRATATRAKAPAKAKAAAQSAQSLLKNLGIPGL